MDFVHPHLHRWLLSFLVLVTDTSFSLGISKSESNANQPRECCLDALLPLDASLKIALLLILKIVLYLLQQVSLFATAGISFSWHLKIQHFHVLLVIFLKKTIKKKKK